MTFERARTKEQIEARKTEIIRACSRLYDQYDIEGVNIKAISEMTSFVRSSIYTYYKTKEEILLDVLLQDIREWSEDILMMMEDHDQMTKEKYCQSLTAIFNINSRMLKLTSILYSVIEKNASVNHLTHFKNKFFELLQPFYESLDKYFPEANAKAKENFIYQATALVSGLYPMTVPTEKQKQAMSLSKYDFKALNFDQLCYNGLLTLIKPL
ncbi:MAG: TetR family transcriptional regulator [Clostridia bacterium]|nr:TetR family transcriptional regulator [Clostridia bacterium]